MSYQGGYQSGYSSSNYKNPSNNLNAAPRGRPQRTSKPRRKPSARQRRGIKSAAIIRRRARGDGLVEEKVYDILKVIEDDVEKAVESGHNVARTELPTEFHIPPMPRQEAQRQVYYYILKELVMSEYSPKIEIVGNKSGTQKVYVYTKWDTPEDEEEDEYMDKFIRAHSLVSEDTESNNGIKPSGRRRRRPKK